MTVVCYSQQANHVRTRLQIMGQWITEMEYESEKDLAKELHGAEEDSSKFSMSPINNEDILETSHDGSKVQGVRVEHPWAISGSSSPIIISDVSFVECCFHVIYKVPILRGRLNWFYRRKMRIT